ncbi:MAG: ATP-binding protein, partial [Thermoplasmata archaeon]|nr:ATP-binding protein [Thermoplasmata archaeon]
MIQQFIGRTAELAFLEERYSSKKAEFIVIYGRRRIGKTELIHRFTSGKPHVYFQCEKSEMNVMLEEFQQRVAKSLGNDIFGRLRISSWYELFEELVNRIPGWDGTQGEAGGEVRGGSGGEAPEQSQKFIIVLDEFPYLAEVDNSITSVFQKIWNEILSRAQIMLILCGSSIGMMEKEVLSARSPLFGRRTGQIFLRALSPFEIGKFLPNYSFKDIAMVYGVCDGIPAYIEKFDPELSFDENLREKVLNKNEYLYAEGEFLLKSEFREYRKYFLILSIISRGKRSFNEIINTSGLDKGLVSKYLSNLQALHLIEVDHP